MAKHQVKAWIHYEASPRYSKDGGPHISLLPFKASADSTTWGVPVREEVFEIEIPDDFDPRPQQIADLNAQKQELRAKFAAAVKEIDDRIASLLAIENKPSEATE